MIGLKFVGTLARTNKMSREHSWFYCAKCPHFQPRHNTGWICFNMFYWNGSYSCGLLDHDWEGVTATTPEWFGVRRRDVPRAQLNYNMTKQLCIKCIYDKIRSKSPPHRAPSPSCLHCDVMHLSLTTGFVAWHIPSWRVWPRDEHRQAGKTVWQEDWFVAIKIIDMDSSITTNIYDIVFWKYKSRFEHNHN